VSENRELDVLVAEQVMGWPVFTQPDNPEGNDEWYASLPFPCLILHSSGGYWLQRGWLDMVDFRPSESIEAAMQVENRIAELGLQTRYVLELAKIVDPRSNRNDAVMSLWWALVHATSEQRCRSAYAAVKDQNGEGAQ
jgi:hypothetical protein